MVELTDSLIMARAKIEQATRFIRYFGKHAWLK